MAVVWRNVNPADELEPNVKFRLAFRDVTDWLGVVTSWFPPLNLTDKALKFYETLAGGPIAFPVSQPVIGEGGTVFVIDVRTKSDVYPQPIRNAMALVQDAVPGLELVSVELVSSSEGSSAAVEGRERTFQEASKLDATADRSSNPLAGPADAAERAIAGVGVTAVLIGAIVVVMLARKYAT